MTLERVTREPGFDYMEVRTPLDTEAAAKLYAEDGWEFLPNHGPYLVFRRKTRKPWVCDVAGAEGA